jgi:transcriptional regulator with XRE-family HTH domain
MSREICIAPEKIISRIKQVYDVTTDSELAEILNTSRSTISNWRQRGRVSFYMIIKKLAPKGIDLNYLIYGGVPVTRTESGDYVVNENIADYDTGKVTILPHVVIMPRKKYEEIIEAIESLKKI